MSLQTHNAPVPSWANQAVELYHGTLLTHAQVIAGPSTVTGCNWNIDLTRCKLRRDFGRGFYTTTSRLQAESWALEMADRTGSSAGLVTLTCDRDRLAALDTLAFARGDYDAEDFWRFVFFCRSGATDHGRNVFGAAVYDLVYGPVAAFWAQRSCMSGADQISFHSPAAVNCISSIIADPVP